MVSISYDVLRYENLLERLYSRLPSKTSSQPIELPQLEVVHVGLHTHVKNFKEVCDRIRREPRIVMRYLLKELAARGSLDDSNNLIIFGRISSQTLNTLFNRFLMTYVKCSTCNSFDTVLKKQGKVWVISCLACGAETPVKPV